MTHRLTTNYAKNYCNRTLIVNVIVENVVTCFFGTRCSLFYIAYNVQTVQQTSGLTYILTSRQCITVWYGNAMVFVNRCPALHDHWLFFWMDLTSLVPHIEHTVWLGYRPRYHLTFDCYCPLYNSLTNTIFYTLSRLCCLQGIRSR